MHPAPTSRVHAFAREQKILMLTLVTGLVAELGIDSPQLLAEQLITLAHAEQPQRQLVVATPRRSVI